VKKKITWMKFVDPLGSNLDDVEMPGFEDDEESEIMSDMEDEGMFAKQNLQVMQTPFGVMTVGDHSVVSRQFDFWWLFSNFSITSEILNMIEAVPGVEIIDKYCLTRYRMKIGFPISGLFDSAKVKANIQAIIDNIDAEVDTIKDDELANFLPQEIIEEVGVVRNQIREYNYWSIAVLPNGRISHVEDNDLSDNFLHNTFIYKLATQLVDGYLLSSSDYQ